eukprot:SAG25_NODE_103_length_15482_cov_9.187415_12_plen_120_part_00
MVQAHAARWHSPALPVTGTTHSTETPTFWHARRGESLQRGYDEATGRPLWTADPALDLAASQMPNCVRCAVPAGHVVLFDTCIYHVALPNTSRRDRVGTIASFSGDNRCGRRVCCRSSI